MAPGGHSTSKALGSPWLWTFFRSPLMRSALKTTRWMFPASNSARNWSMRSLAWPGMLFMTIMISISEKTITTIQPSTPRDMRTGVPGGRLPDGRSSRSGC